MGPAGTLRSAAPPAPTAGAGAGRAAPWGRLRPRVQTQSLAGGSWLPAAELQLRPEHALKKN